VSAHAPKGARRPSAAAGTPPPPLEHLAAAMYLLNEDFWCLMFARDDAERGELVASMGQRALLLMTEIAHARGWLHDRRSRATRRANAAGLAAAGAGKAVPDE
jgi:hypothetical protein